MSAIRDIFLLGKFRLSVVVVFSAIMSFLIAKGGQAPWADCLLLVFFGMMVTMSANACNEIIEQKYDALMERTRDRPLPAGRMQPWQAVMFAVLTGIAGVGGLAAWFNWQAGVLGFLALASYVAVYTPLKRVGPVAVLVGALPGALPVVIGWVAAAGELSLLAWVLFGQQFIWQFPHFWSIGWLAHDDYSRAGFKLMPWDDGRTPLNAHIIVVSAVVLCLAGLLPLLLPDPYRWWVSAAGVLAGALMLLAAIRLMKQQNRPAALSLMFSSFVYLPLTQTAFLLNCLLA